MWITSNKEFHLLLYSFLHKRYLGTLTLGLEIREMANMSCCCGHSIPYRRHANYHYMYICIIIGTYTISIYSWVKNTILIVTTY